MINYLKNHKSEIEDQVLENPTTEQVLDPEILPAGVVRYLHVDVENRGGMVIREDSDVQFEIKNYESIGNHYSGIYAGHFEILGPSEFVDAEYMIPGKVEGTQEYKDDYLPNTATRYYVKTSAAIRVRGLKRDEKGNILKDKIHFKNGCG